MKEKEIVKEICKQLNGKMEKLGYEFNKRWGSYRKFDPHEQLYFEIAFLFLDSVDIGTNSKSKYLEIFLDIYHIPTSKLLFETMTRGKNLDSFFYFKIVGNMLSDIVMNPDWCNYTNRNNHNYFKLEFVTENDIICRSNEILDLVHKYSIPFFEKLNSAEKIKEALDCCYDKGIVLHNVNNERLFALVSLLFHFNDPQKNENIRRIKDYFLYVNNNRAMLELSALIQKLENN